MFLKKVESNPLIQNSVRQIDNQAHTHAMCFLNSSIKLRNNWFLTKHELERPFPSNEKVGSEAVWIKQNSYCSTSPKCLNIWFWWRKHSSMNVYFAGFYAAPFQHVISPWVRNVTDLHEKFNILKSFLKQYQYLSRIHTACMFTDKVDSWLKIPQLLKLWPRVSVHPNCSLYN